MLSYAPLMCVWFIDKIGYPISKAATGKTVKVSAGESFAERMSSKITQTTPQIPQILTLPLDTKQVRIIQQQCPEAKDL